VAIDIDIDIDLLKSEIKKTYASVSDEPEKDFVFPTGRAWAEDLGYPAELANVPDTAVESSRASPIPGSSAGSLPVNGSTTSAPEPERTPWSLPRWSAPTVA
jgi:hypothetical protein